MMNNNTINFYDVVNEAELYFGTIDFYTKGSGYKNFMRWVKIMNINTIPLEIGYL